MTYQFSFNAFFKGFLLVAATAMGSLQVNAQSKETTDALQVAPDNDEVDSAASISASTIKRHSFGSIVFADLGGTSLMTKASGKTTQANGLSWAIVAQGAFAVQSRNMKMKTMISAGLELRNFNATSSSTDRFGGTAYDNLHYWYVGIPVNLQLMSTRYNTGKKATTGYYVQAGFTTGFTTNVNDVYSMQGVTTTYDTTGHYKNYMLLPNIGAGITCTTPRAIYMIGPFAGYTINSLVPNSAVEQHIFSYGIRFSTLFF